MKTERRSVLKKLFASVVGVTGLGVVEIRLPEIYIWANTAQLNLPQAGHSKNRFVRKCWFQKALLWQPDIILFILLAFFNFTENYK